MVIPAGAVEAAWHGFWNHSDRSGIESMRAALEAAAPHMHAYLLAELRDRDNADQFALSISAEGYPRNVGPFRTREDAEEWMAGRKLTGSWNVYPLRAAVAAAGGGGE